MTDPVDPVDPADTIARRIDRLERTMERVLYLISRIHRDLARTSAPVLLDAPDGTVAIRDPNILAQEQATGMRGNAPYVPPPPPE